jgi:hypothetical protein
MLARDTLRGKLGGGSMDLDMVLPRGSARMAGCRWGNGGWKLIAENWRRYGGCLPHYVVVHVYVYLRRQCACGHRYVPCQHPWLTRHSIDDGKPLSAYMSTRHARHSVAYTARKLKELDFTCLPPVEFILTRYCMNLSAETISVKVAHCPVWGTEFTEP